MTTNEPCSHPWFHWAVLSSPSSPCESADLLRALISTSHAATPTDAENHGFLHPAVHSKRNNKHRQPFILQPSSRLICISQWVSYSVKNHLFGIWEITAQCDAWFSALYKYSYLLTYLLKKSLASDGLVCLEARYCVSYRTDRVNTVM